MSVNFRYPNITGASEREQLTQLKRYLYQLVDQLNYSFSTISVDSGDKQSEQKEERQ